MKHSVGKTIAQLRTEKGWTQVELAEKLQVSDKAVSKWEKDGGLPSIEFFPVMSELFGVSIDYLLTGKTCEKEIVMISKAELCAKNDDVALANEVLNLSSDEQGKNIVDYILQYQSFKVFKRLCEIDAKFINRFKILDAINFAILSNSLSLLDHSEFSLRVGYRFDFENWNEIKNLRSVEDSEYFKNNREKEVCILPRSFFTMLVTDKRINETTMSELLTAQNGRKCVWYHAFPYMIDEAYKNGNNDLLHRLIDVAKNNNDNGYEIISAIKYNFYNNKLSYFFVSCGFGKEGYGFVRILESTIKSALEKGDFELFNELNDINIRVEEFLKNKFEFDYSNSSKCYIASDDEIRVAKLKLDKSISQTELQVQSAIQEGIICIDELLEVKGFKTIKSALEKYPIHRLEQLYNMLKEGKNRELFQMAVDDKNTKFATLIIKNNKEDILEYIFSCYKNYNGINGRHLYYFENGRRIDLSNISYNTKNIDMFLEKLNLCKQRIINELSLKMDKERIAGDLTKEFFENELSKGNTDMVIVKLCVLLEAILRCDYHYEGDLSDMISKYCSGFNTYDDEGNDFDPYTPKMLHKLRMNRNSIVHSEKCKETLTIDDIKWCIDYICDFK